MQAPAIRLRHVTQRFDGAVAVDDLCLDVPRGEIFGFIGPNGAGKTTTLRIIATLLEPTYGKVEIEGIDAIEDPHGVRRSIGYMPDYAGVYERVTVREYLDFFATAAGVSSRAPVDAAIELTRIGDLQNRLVAELSKGMRQRLGLSRVLLHEPKVLVLDEPASDLDPRARVEMRDLLVELKELGKTIFLSSHILAELDDVCTSVAIIERGRLLVSGPIQTIGGALATGTAAVDPARAVTVGDPDVAAPAPSTQLSVKIRILGEAAFHLAPLRAVPGVTRVTGGAGGVLVVDYGGDERVVGDVVRALVTAGAPVVAVERERAALERIFLEVTEGSGS